MFLFYFYFRKDPLVIGKFVVVLATQIESECDSLAHNGGAGSLCLEISSDLYFQESGINDKE